jgi:hypothetical protein
MNLWHFYINYPFLKIYFRRILESRKLPNLGTVGGGASAPGIIGRLTRRSRCLFCLPSDKVCDFGAKDSKNPAVSLFFS